ncbi:MAG: hypothetical protein SFW63_09430 [Alphaproteobacteria bacterium]|nr:hypothetical protein [Alphaproteobacteria bacterium]
MLKVAAISITILILSACAVDTDEINRHIIERAEFDLSCGREKIQTKLLQDDVFGEEYIYGADGCGKKQTYQVINDFGVVKIYKEGAAPDKVIINNNTHVTTPSPVAVPPLSTQFK